jgi:hypothetical protein
MLRREVAEAEQRQLMFLVDQSPSTALFMIKLFVHILQTTAVFTRIEWRTALNALSTKVPSQLIKSSSQRR